MQDEENKGVGKVYKVRWEIDIIAFTPEEAALIASYIMKDEENWVRVFKVRKLSKETFIEIDLDQKGIPPITREDIHPSDDG